MYTASPSERKASSHPPIQPTTVQVQKKKKKAQKSTLTRTPMLKPKSQKREKEQKSRSSWLAIRFFGAFSLLRVESEEDAVVLDVIAITVGEIAVAV